MADMDKLWTEVDSLKETRIRHDERMKRLETEHKQLLQHIASVEVSVSEMRDEIREGFKQVNKQITDMDNQKAQRKGYDSGVKETRAAMFKQFGLWVSIVGLGLSFIVWQVTK